MTLDGEGMLGMSFHMSNSISPAIFIMKYIAPYINLINDVPNRETEANLAALEWRHKQKTHSCPKL